MIAANLRLVSGFVVNDQLLFVSYLLTALPLASPSFTQLGTFSEYANRFYTPADYNLSQDIALNGLARADIEGAQGGTIGMGGRVIGILGSPVIFSGSAPAQFTFGNTFGYAAFLDITTEDLVPEPGGCGTRAAGCGSDGIASSRCCDAPAGRSSPLAIAGAGLSHRQNRTSTGLPWKTRLRVPGSPASRTTMCRFAGASILEPLASRSVSRRWRLFHAMLIRMNSPLR